MTQTNNRDSLNLSKLAYFDLSGEGFDKDVDLAQTLYKTDDFGNFLTNDIGYPIVDRENFKNRPDLKPLLDTLEQFPDYKETLDKYKVLTTIDKLTGYQATAFQNMDNNQVGLHLMTVWLLWIVMETELLIMVENYSEMRL